MAPLSAQYHAKWLLRRLPPPPRLNDLRAAQDRRWIGARHCRCRCGEASYFVHNSADNLSALSLILATAKTIQTDANITCLKCDQRNVLESETISDPFIAASSAQS